MTSSYFGRSVQEVLDEVGDRAVELFEDLGAAVSRCPTVLGSSNG
ncbi:MAG: hypothetical protein ACR2F6_00200 [Mycobacteriales bacterium]